MEIYARSGFGSASVFGTIECADEQKILAGRVSHSHCSPRLRRRVYVHIYREGDVEKSFPNVRSITFCKLYRFFENIFLIKRKASFFSESFYWFSFSMPDFFIVKKTKKNKN